MTIIYKYTNRMNGKVYVGKTDRLLEVRHKEHCCLRSRDKTAFDAAKRKYGISCFSLDKLCEVDAAFGDFAEMLFIVALKSNNRYFGYNLTNGGDGASGLRMSESAKEKLRIIGKSHKMPEWTDERKEREHKRMLGNKFGCVSRSKEFKQKVSVAQLGKIMSADAVLRRQLARYGPSYIPRGLHGVWARKQARRRHARSNRIT